tara:strand:+ start:328225 stop:329076 length:852 start_codon:yes stop_codon:yes gene_type:complete
MRFFRRLAGMGSGWKTFGFEVAIVVVGVVIALLGNHLVTVMNREAEMEQSMEAIENDLLVALFFFNEREAIEPCRLEQEANLLLRLQEDDEIWRPVLSDSLNADNPITTLPMVLRTPLRPVSTTSWETFAEGESAVYLEREVFSTLSYLFGTIAQMTENGYEIWRLKGRLSHLAVEGTITPLQRREAIAMLGEISALDGVQFVHASQLSDLLDQYEFQTDGRVYEWGATVEEFEQIIPRMFRNLRQTYGECVDPSAYQDFIELYERLSGFDVDDRMLKRGSGP